MQIQPYLFFDGRCEEAIAFYQKVLKAEVVMKMHFKDAPDQSMIQPAHRDKVMHSTLKIGDSIVFASDGHCQGSAKFEGFSLSYTAANDAEAERIFAALGEGGEVGMPMSPTFFATRFGMTKDRFGVGWMVIVPKEM